MRGGGGKMQFYPQDIYTLITKKFSKDIYHIMSGSNEGYEEKKKTTAQE